MIIQFKDRRRELAELEEVLNSKKQELIIIYGRRRIGKTELILKATEKRKRIYYLAVGERNLDRFYSICEQNFSEVSKLKKSWEVLFDFLKDHAETVIIDEFQNLIKEDKNILHIFHSIVDLTLKGSTLKLFLLGSSISIITSKVLDYQSPLYGRRTGSIELKAIPFSELDKFFPDSNFEELISIYGFADGIPHYLKRIDKKFWSWLDIELKRQRSFVRDEVDFLLRYEFEDVSTYKLILEAIANGKTKLNEIKDYIKVKRTDITPYLRNLLEIKMILREVPITENIKSRFGRYYLTDNFLKFWFRYIYPNLSRLEDGSLNSNEIRKDYNVYLGNIFESMCRDVIKREFKGKVGRWWHKDKEIDIVALNESTKEILLCECKWQNNVKAKKVLEELKEKSKFVDWNREKRKESFAIFAKSFKEKVKEKDLKLFDLKDIERVIKR